jgi:hypothetical protein
MSENKIVNIPTEDKILSRKKELMFKDRDYPENSHYTSELRSRIIFCQNRKRLMQNQISDFKAQVNEITDEPARREDVATQDRINALEGFIARNEESFRICEYEESKYQKQHEELTGKTFVRKAQTSKFNAVGSSGNQYLKMKSVI